MENLVQIVQILVGEGKVASCEARSMDWSRKNEKTDMYLEFSGGSTFFIVLLAC